MEVIKRYNDRIKMYKEIISKRKFPQDSYYQTRLEEAKRILSLIKKDKITPEIFDLFSDHDKWDVYNFLIGRVDWFCGYCKCSQDTPRRMVDGELICSNCENTLTYRTGGGQSDPFNWKFTYNQKEIRKLKLKKLDA